MSEPEETEDPIEVLDIHEGGDLFHASLTAYLGILEGRLRTGTSVVDFKVAVSEDGEVRISWDSQGGIWSGENGTDRSQFEDATRQPGEGIYDWVMHRLRLSRKGGGVDDPENAIFFATCETLDRMENWLTEQPIYKTGVALALARWVMRTEEKLGDLNEALTKNLDRPTQVALLGHQEKSVREWAIKRIGATKIKGETRG